MPISHAVWSLDNKAPLEASALNSERELEQLLVDNIDILNNGWLVISNQVKTDAGKFIDILCIDHDGDMVVVELKKDMTPREVTAQAIDYAASVSKLTSDEISQIYLKFTNDTESLSEAYKNKFGIELDDESINQHVKMVIVAADMDSSTERIITFLRDTYKVDINILFFEIYKCGNERLISRAWFEEDVEESNSPNASQNLAWNNEYYVSFGDGDKRTWKDAKKYGFISAGGGKWYTQTLEKLSVGDRVWANIPHVGYVGVGKVSEKKKIADDVEFYHNGQSTPMKNLPLKGNYFYSSDPETAEYVVKIDWIKTVESSNAVRESGFFGNQNTVCCPESSRWDFTIQRLKKLWGIN